MLLVVRLIGFCYSPSYDHASCSENASASRFTKEHGDIAKGGFAAGFLPTACMLRPTDLTCRYPRLWPLQTHVRATKGRAGRARENTHRSTPAEEAHALPLRSRTPADHVPLICTLYMCIVCAKACQTSVFTAMSTTSSSSPRMHVRFQRCIYMRMHSRASARLSVPFTSELPSHSRAASATKASQVLRFSGVWRGQPPPERRR